MPTNRPANRAYNKPLTTVAERAAATKARRQADAEEARDIALAKIASIYLGRETLETRSSDRLDFSDQAVWSLKAALEAAYAAGKAAK